MLDQPAGKPVELSSELLKSIAQRPVSTEFVDLAYQTMGGKDPVDVDIQLAIALAAFIITWMALKVLLFDPYLKVRDLRRQGTSGNRDEAIELNKRAEDTLAKYEAELNTARQEAKSLRATSQEESISEQKAFLEKAYGEAAVVLADGRAKLETQLTGARAELDAEAKTLAADIAKRLLPA